jgi:hypothetical protein
VAIAIAPNVGTISMAIVRSAGLRRDTMAITELTGGIPQR